MRSSFSLYSLRSDIYHRLMVFATAAMTAACFGYIAALTAGLI